MLRYQPGHSGGVAGTLPVPVANAGAGVLGGTAFLVGGDDGVRPVPAVTEFRLVPQAAASRRRHRAARCGPGIQRVTPRRPGAPWLAPAHGRGHLAPGSDPAALPGDVLIADNLNNRLLIVDPQGRIRWQFPRPGDLARGQTFLVPDDAFFSPDGQHIIATEEDDSVISVINIATHRIIYRYGTPGCPGRGAEPRVQPGRRDAAAGRRPADRRHQELPDPAGQAARARPDADHRPGRLAAAAHNPPHRFGSPNGAFPMTNGDYLVTEINGDWVNAMSLSGHVAWSANPPGVSYPSDTNEVYPGRYLTADYSSPGPGGGVHRGRAAALAFRRANHPSLALPLPNGDILVNDDYNHRVIVIDPVSNRIVWQYGHTGVAGSRPGYLSKPDGVDLAPPDSMLIAHAATMGRP